MLAPSLPPAPRRRTDFVPGGDDIPPRSCAPQRSNPTAGDRAQSSWWHPGVERQNPAPSGLPRPRPVTHSAHPMVAVGGGARPEGAVRRCLWRQCARRVHGERVRWPTSGPRHRGTGTAKMSASLVRATVRAVSKRKLQPTRAALTLVSACGAWWGP